MKYVVYSAVNSSVAMPLSHADIESPHVCRQHNVELCKTQKRRGLCLGGFSPDATGGTNKMEPNPPGANQFTVTSLMRTDYGMT